MAEASANQPTIERLDVENYATWSIRMQAFLMVKGLWGAVTGDSTDATVDKKALAQIILHVKDYHLPTLVGCATSKIAWETLKAMFQAKTNARKLLLRRELTQLKMGATEPLSVYAARAKELQTHLRSAGDEVRDQEVALQFLAGLPPAYGMISTVLTAGDHELKIDGMMPKLMQVEQLAEPPVTRFTEAALYAKPNGTGRASFIHDETTGPTCYYCGKKGHIERNCRKKKRENGEVYNAIAL